MPDDLNERSEHRAEVGFPTSVGVVWESSTSDRAVRFHSAASDEPRGHGYAGEPTQREVQGATATDYVVEEDIHTIIWQQPGASEPCTYWSVVSFGLTEKELDTVLTSLHEES